MKSNKIIIFSAPSGSGKTTIIHYLLSIFPKLSFSISCTTRKIRSYEKDGKDYYFISHKSFRDKVQKNQFAEWEEVYPGVFYGTLKNEIEKILDSDRHILFDVDVKGGINLKKQYSKYALSIFIQPYFLNELYKRLKIRGTESSLDMSIRFKKAQDEFSYASLFDLILVNDDLLIAKEQAKYWIKNFIEKK